MTLIESLDGGARCRLHSPTALPQASAFLWNRRLMIQLSCRGYANAQFMQPEPAKYAHAPQLEAQTFMQPEPAYYAHHPGRFFYVKDEADGCLFSAPHEPVRAAPEAFHFEASADCVRWQLQCHGVQLNLCLRLPADEAVELWELRLSNPGVRPRQLSLYPYFPIGYMSWMNQSAEYRADLGGIVARCVTPYQKVADHFKQRHFKDLTYLLAEQPVHAWEANQAAFEGEGGLHAPSALTGPTLAGGDARYETPCAALQQRLVLAPGEAQTFRYAFGPAFDDAEVAAVRARWLHATGFARATAEQSSYQAPGRAGLHLRTPDADFDAFVNHWLGRQVLYHGDVNRLSTDPQTRNYLQDQLGMAYLQPQRTRDALLLALAQQKADGSMPDGILLAEGAELKYINQVPHSDHCVWLPLCLQAYLDETADAALLATPVRDAQGLTRSVAERLDAAMAWLLHDRDARGLSFIAQGDWCDPMNMVGWQGRGVSGWLTVAAAYAMGVWAELCAGTGRKDAATRWRDAAAQLNAAGNQHLWDGDWYARGITDDNRPFGVRSDPEGRLYLNPQAWAILSGAADPERRERLLRAVQAQLETPHGVALFNPPYTAMREDIGRLTQKHPGSAENAAVYNHAAAFYVFSLYHCGEADRAYRLLRQMLPGPDEADLRQRGQLPVFIPNYYRGAHQLHPRTAGRSSQLFNTGSAAWALRCVIEGLCGLRGTPEGLRVQPQLPAHWDHLSAERRFRGAQIALTVRRTGQQRLRVQGRLQAEPLIREVVAGQRYDVDIEIV